MENKNLLKEAEEIANEFSLISLIEAKVVFTNTTEKAYHALIILDTTTIWFEDFKKIVQICKKHNWEHSGVSATKWNNLHRLEFNCFKWLK